MNDFAVKRIENHNSISQFTVEILVLFHLNVVHGLA